MSERSKDSATFVGRLNLAVEDLERAERREISDAELARRLSVERATINHYRLGRRQPDLAMIARLAATLGVSASYLAFGETGALRHDEMEVVSAYRRAPHAHQRAIRDLLIPHDTDRDPDNNHRSD